MFNELIKLENIILSIKTNESLLSFVFSDCISIVFQPLVAAAAEAPKVECSDGFTRNIVPLVAAWLGDREEHETVASLVKVQCIVVFCDV